MITKLLFISVALIGSIALGTTAAVAFPSSKTVDAVVFAPNPTPTDAPIDTPSVIENQTYQPTQAVIAPTAIPQKANSTANNNSSYTTSTYDYPTFVPLPTIIPYSTTQPLPTNVPVDHSAVQQACKDQENNTYKDIIQGINAHYGGTTGVGAFELTQAQAQHEQKLNYCANL